MTSNLNSGGKAVEKIRIPAQSENYRTNPPALQTKKLAAREPERNSGKLKLMRLLPWLILVLPPLAAARVPVHARHAMVVTVEPHATDIGVDVLKSGGNAIDAAVAIGFALAATHPSAGNLGGGGFMLVRFADGRTTFLDFRERAPASASRDMYLDASGNATQDSITGYRASGVPGTVAGLEFAHRNYGRKAWAGLLAPAIK